MQRRQWQRGISELSLASAAPMPDDVLGAIHKNLGVCYLRLGEAATARTHLDQAVRLFGERIDRETEQLAATAQESPELQLDREVESVQLNEWERPMWEAFEQAQVTRSR
jgi:hypothetical protein